jgi:hypothetical protein
MRSSISASEPQDSNQYSLELQPPGSRARNWAARPADKRARVAVRPGECLPARFRAARARDKRPRTREARDAAAEERGRTLRRPRRSRSGASWHNIQAGCGFNNGSNYCDSPSGLALPDVGVGCPFAVVSVTVSCGIADSFFCGCGFAAGSGVATCVFPLTGFTDMS